MIILADSSMLNYLWAGMILVGIVYGILTGNVSDSVKKGALVVGMNSSSFEILLYAKAYSYNGNKRGFLYSISSDNEFNKDSTLNPLSHNAFFLLSPR